MKKLLLCLLFPFSAGITFSQITYISITNHNVGSGSNNLFNNYVAVGQQCYIDWEVYAEGMTVMEACGFRSDSRLVLRRTGNTDATSVVASEPIIVPGTCAGKVGNNDHYYADLSSYINKPGRYTVEVQADLPNMTYPFENASTKTTWNYLCPSAYYLTGSNGPTGNYYTPSGNCAVGPGLSDPVGGQGADMLAEIYPALKYFTVGEAGAYRHMAVINNNFYDLPTGKLQPGNPSLPASLNGTNGIPSYGICPIAPAPTLSLGGEINNFKRTDCSADVTGAAIFYRVYKDGTAPPAFASFNLNFKDDCPFSPNGPEGNTFTTGGSCQNANNILDQRWQTLDGATNIMPASFALSDTGLWIIELYTETNLKNCAGIAGIDISDTATTSFTVNNPEANGSPCGNVIPVKLVSFTATPGANNNLLQWKIEEATNIKSFDIQISFDAYTFSSIGNVAYSNGKAVYSFTDAAYPNRIVFYRLAINENDGKKIYSPVIKLAAKNNGISIAAQVLPQQLFVSLENFAKGKISVAVYNTAGSIVAAANNVILQPGNSNLRMEMKYGLANGIYYIVARDESGHIIAKADFYY